MVMPWRLAQSVVRAFRASLSPTRPSSSPTAAGFSEPVLDTAAGPLQAAIWYPAEGVEAPVAYGRMYRGLVVQDASPKPGLSPRPLALLSHGLNANRHDLAWLGERLCAHGWVSVAIDHPGSTYTDFERTRAMQLWTRARTLSQALDTLLAHPVWGPHIDAGRVAAIGHSAGGSTVLMLGGARLNRERFSRFFRRSVDESMDLPCHDARFRAILALAPGTGIAFTAAGLKEARTPVLLYSGTDDWQTPDRLCAAHYAKHLPQCVWHSIPHGGHYTFKPPCQSYACVRVPGLCCDHPSVDRKVLHDRVASEAVAFFARHL